MQGMRKTPIIWKSGGGHTVYLITFYAGEGSCDTAFLYTDVEGKLSALPEATRQDYDFDGWFTAAGEQVTTETVFTADTVVEARWTYRPVYTITVTGSGSTSGGMQATVYLTMPDGTTVTGAGTYQTNDGDTIVCYAKLGYGAAGSATVTLNGETVSSGSPATYNYVPKADATIALTSSSRAGSITITES